MSFSAMLKEKINTKSEEIHHKQIEIENLTIEINEGCDYDTAYEIVKKVEEIKKEKKVLYIEFWTLCDLLQDYRIRCRKRG